MPAGRTSPNRVDDPRFFRAVDQVIDQNPEPALRPRREIGDDTGQVVHSPEILDDHTLDAQVITPDLLDQLGIVAPST